MLQLSLGLHISRATWGCNAMPSNSLMFGLLQGWVVAMAAAMVPPMARGWGMAQGATGQVLMVARWAPLGRQVISTVHRCTFFSNQEGL